MTETPALNKVKSRIMRLDTTHIIGYPYVVITVAIKSESTIRLDIKGVARLVITRMGYVMTKERAAYVFVVPDKYLAIIEHHSLSL